MRHGSSLLGLFRNNSQVYTADWWWWTNLFGQIESNCYKWDQWHWWCEDNSLKSFPNFTARQFSKQKKHFQSIFAGCHLCSVLWATAVSSSWVGTALRLLPLRFHCFARSWIKHCLNCYHTVVPPTALSPLRQRFLTQVVLNCRTNVNQRQGLLSTRTKSVRKKIVHRKPEMISWK